MMNLRDNLQLQFAEDSVIYLKKYKSGIADITQRFGKIRYTVRVMDLLFEKPPRVLIAYPISLIKTSWENEFEVLGYDTSSIFYTNTASLSKYVNKQWDLLVIDEIHKLSKQELLHCLKLMNNTTYVIGLTGTMSIETKIELSTALGIDVMVKYSQEDGIDDDVISDYQVYIHQVDLDDKIKTPNSKGVMKSEKEKYSAYTYVINKKKETKDPYTNLLLMRNRLSQGSIAKKSKLLDLLKKFKDKRVIVFTGTTKIAESLGIPFYHSKCKNTSLSDFQSCKESKLALIGIGKEGITYKDLDIVIMSDFTGNEETTSQILSRAMIKDRDNKIAELHMIVLNEDPEIKKLNKTLELLNPNKIKYINGNKHS